MVQIDVFWSYGFGATYALIAGRMLKKEHEEDPAKAKANQFYSKPFVLNLLFLSILFVPSGVFLLWGSPDWETMMVATTHTSISRWLAAGFAMTNITQGILGYWITRKFIVKGEFYKAYLNFAISTILFWFVLVHGWDGTGYQRFFSENQHAFLNPETHSFWQWQIGPAFSLFILGLFVLPGLIITWYPLWKESIQIERDALEGTDAASKPLSRAKDRRLKLNGFNGYMGMTLIGGVAAAAVVTIILHYSGWLIGTPLVLAFYYFMVIRKNSPCYPFYKLLMYTNQSVYTIKLSHPSKEKPTRSAGEEDDGKPEGSFVFSESSAG